jgi:hypothetical protein
MMTIRGWIDEINEHRVRGWAHYLENPARSEKITISINGSDVLQVLACKERGDLSSQYISFTKKGFEFHLVDFIDRPVNLIKITHAETRQALGEDQYLIFSTNPSLWEQAQDHDLFAVRNVFANQRTYFQTPFSGAWNQEIDFSSVVKALIPHLEGSKKVSVLQFEPPSTTFARTLANEKNVSRLGIVERAAQLHDWHIDNNKVSIRPEMYSDIDEPHQLWDVAFLPLTHEKSGPSFVDILETVSRLLNPSGLLLFDIKIDPTSRYSYLLSDGNRLLRISSVDDATKELNQAGFKVLKSWDFIYTSQDSHSVRKMILAGRAAIGDRT